LLSCCFRLVRFSAGSVKDSFLRLSGRLPFQPGLPEGIRTAPFFSIFYSPAAFPAPGEEEDCCFVRASRSSFIPGFVGLCGFFSFSIGGAPHPQLFFFFLFRGPRSTIRSLSARPLFPVLFQRRPPFPPSLLGVSASAAPHPPVGLLHTQNRRDFFWPVIPSIVLLLLCPPPQNQHHFFLDTIYLSCTSTFLYVIRNDFLFLFPPLAPNVLWLFCFLLPWTSPFNFIPVKECPVAFIISASSLLRWHCRFFFWPPPPLPLRYTRGVLFKQFTLWLSAKVDLNFFDGVPFLFFCWCDAR